MATHITSTQVLASTGKGITLIPDGTSLTRLNYFDGRYLGVEDLTREQDYLIALARQGNRAGGAGVVHGFELSLRSGMRLRLAAGLAIDAEGRVLMLPDGAEVEIAQLLASQGRAAPTPGPAPGGGNFAGCVATDGMPQADPVAASSLYLIGIAHAEARCGRAEVWGQACASACAQQADYDTRREGVRLLAEPLTLASPLPASSAFDFTGAHLRSRVASAYFADEAARHGKVMGAALLRSPSWCQGAAPEADGMVPLGILAVAGGQVRFLDGWSARRERIDGMPRRHWQWQMMMRPWDVFLAQVLQFQCQLVHVLTEAPAPGGDDDPCLGLRRLVVEASDAMQVLQRFYQGTAKRLAGAAEAGAGLPGGPGGLALLADRLARATRSVTLAATDRVLLEGGIVELPSAGYLPVAPGDTLSVNRQVQALLGEGVALRFCAVRPDAVARAWEAAQHLERISLTRGLDDPQQQEQVDILVPDGRLADGGRHGDAGWRVQVRAADEGTARQPDPAYRAGTADYAPSVLAGAARSTGSGGGAAFHFAGMMETAGKGEALAAARAWAKAHPNSMAGAGWKTVTLLARDAPQGREAAKTAGDGATAMRYMRLRTEAGQVRAQRAAAAAQRGKTSRVRYAGLGDARVDHVALWVSAEAGGEVFEAAEGALVPLRLDLTVLMPGEGAGQFLDVALLGKLRIDHRSHHRDGLAVQATFNGSAALSGSFAGTGGRQLVPLSVPVLLRRELDALGGTLRIDADLHGVQMSEALFDLVAIEAALDWRAEPAAARLALAFVPRDDEALRLQADLVRDDAALLPGHPLRLASETAIQILGTREGSPDFVTDAMADLFGARQPPSEAPVLFARHDWVLFHRRSPHQCAGDCTTAPLSARRYQVFHVRVGSDRQLQGARAAVLSGDSERITKAGFGPVSVVAFAGGRSTLASPLDELLADWAQAEPGTQLVFGAVGSQGAAQGEGEALARSRLGALQLALAGAAGGTVDNLLMPVLPELGLSGLDGAMFLVTRTVKTVCHDVYILPDRAARERFDAQLERAGLQAALQDAGLTPAVHLEFEADGVSLGDAARQALAQVWNPPQLPASALACHGKAGEEEATRQRGTAIVTALAGSPSLLATRLSTDVPKITGCAGLTVLERAVQLGQVLVAIVNYDSYHYVEYESATFHAIGWRDWRPVDGSAFDAAIRDALSRQARGATVNTLAAADPAATRVMEVLQERLLALDPRGAVAQRFTRVLEAPEIEGLKARGMPPQDYLAVIFFSLNGY
ncbi:hypothetical protein N8I74_15325 [Chitiniphilus purpureus]|uniref:Uncharacterized protein n=1 Tax=Chitiniphilus purpureus TaxID=2981137 RepID=A0ABY6DJZ3_9NEIS|nr:hypothetical protein [Chitiniphilus sp. CD1]UXY14675.1 hypothetical protein N8I74_15325 [Chitiniphilus sp. CD1]